MGRVYRPTYCRPIPKGAEIVERGGKQFVRIRIGGPGAKPILAPLTKSGGRCIVPQSKWWAVYRDAEGKLTRAPLVCDLEMSRRMLSALELKVDRLRSGTADPHEYHLTRPLSELLDEFRRNMEDNDLSEGYVEDAVSYISKTVDACEFRTLNDVDAVQIEGFLATQRAKKTLRRPKGLSHGGHNSYVRALKAFGNWLLRKRRCARNPFATLTLLNAKVDRRRVRRAGTVEELARLIAEAGRRPPFLGLAGPDRAILYRVAAETGFRASELASVTRRSASLDADAPTITVTAAYSKHRDDDVQPIPRELAARLRVWLDAPTSEGEPTVQFAEPEDLAGRRLFPGTWHRRAAEMLREDLQAARERWVREAKTRPESDKRANDPDFLKYVDSSGRVIDFHALRGTLGTNLANAGVHPKVAQELMRHSDINLTMMTYTNLRAVDVAAGLDRLPSIPDATSDRLAATGTDDESSWRRSSSSSEPASNQSGIAHSGALTCNETCNSARRAQEHHEHSARETNGAGRTRTDNPRIMSPLL
jgi:integrase